MKVKKVVIKAYYNLDGEYIPFDSNPLHNTSYGNVDVVIKEKEKEICGVKLIVDVIEISGQKPIECELVDEYQDSDGTLIIKICQDWG